MTNAYLISFDTAAEVTPEQRHGLKDLLGRVVRIALDADAYRVQALLLGVEHTEPDGPPVAIDHLDPADPPVQALLVVE